MTAGSGEALRQQLEAKASEANQECAPDLNPYVARRLAEWSTAAVWPLACSSAFWCPHDSCSGCCPNRSPAGDVQHEGERPVIAHRYTGDLWKPDGSTSYYGATCSCGWYETSEQRSERQPNHGITAEVAQEAHTAHVASVVAYLAAYPVDDSPTWQALNGGNK